MKLVEHPLNPTRLFLVWQADFDKVTRKPSGDRHIIGEVRKEGEHMYLHYYDDADVPADFEGMTAFPYKPGGTYNSCVEEVLSKRLAPPSRIDYPDYLRSHRLPNGKYSTLQLLAYTGGILAGDGFSFLYSFDNATPPFDFTFEIAGFRYGEGMKLPDISVLRDKTVSLEPEDGNEYDDFAVKVMYGDILLGRIPMGLSEKVRELLAGKSVSATITRVNGTKDRPIVMVLVEVR